MIKQETLLRRGEKQATLDLNKLFCWSCQKNGQGQGTIKIFA